MTLLQILAAALLHGLFEILPISTDSLDLLLFPALSSQADGWALLVAVWLGLVAAILLVNVRTLYAMGVGLVRRAKGRKDPGAALCAHLGLVSLVPLVGVVVLWKIGGIILSPLWVLGLALGASVLLLLADHLGVTVRRQEHLHIPDSLLLGAGLTAGLIPGVGRLAPVLVIGRLLGYERPDLLRISWLALVPLLLLQAGLMVGQVAQQAQLIFSFDLFLAWLLTLMTALAALSFALGWVERHSLQIFLVLRLGLSMAACVAWWLYPV